MEVTTVIGKGTNTGAHRLGGATTDVDVGGEEWLAAAIEEESNAMVKKAGWKLLGSGRGHATAAAGKEEGKSNVTTMLFFSLFLLFLLLLAAPAKMFVATMMMTPERVGPLPRVAWLVGDLRVTIVGSRSRLRYVPRLMEDMEGRVEEEEEQLPPGFRFHPTDEELITHYLTHKITEADFDARAIAEVDLTKSEPWDLPGKHLGGVLICRRFKGMIPTD
ncbi:hypothetical protein B296_00036887 [Ensete ventricosum]|uniref:NAC domain-containing protein n=1 Tax=Ensete ventricosum TaxID=4639 RepID=A0A426YMS0_ENSVE|nr:hypothetical protein B296_00036887 [Ensete ventricosum]